MKLTFDFNEVMNTAVAHAAGFTVQVTETDQTWEKFMVVTSSGIRGTFASTYGFENHNKPEPTDTEIWLFKVAYEFFEMKRTRLEKQLAENESKLEEIAE